MVWYSGVFTVGGSVSLQLSGNFPITLLHGTRYGDFTIGRSFHSWLHGIHSRIVWLMSPYLVRFFHKREFGFTGCGCGGSRLLG